MGKAIHYSAIILFFNTVILFVVAICILIFVGGDLRLVPKWAYVWFFVTVGWIAILCFIGLIYSLITKDNTVKEEKT